MGWVILLLIIVVVIAAPDVLLALLGVLFLTNPPKGWGWLPNVVGGIFCIGLGIYLLLGAAGFWTQDYDDNRMDFLTTIERLINKLISLVLGAVGLLALLGGILCFFL